MDRPAAEAFASEWIDAWNAHDLDRVLALFVDDVTFTSPHAVQMMEGSSGCVRGKADLRRYWEEGLRRIPDLRFELLAVYTGITAVVINYRNQRGGLANEVLMFDGPLVTEGHGTYSESAPYHDRQ